MAGRTAELISLDELEDLAGRAAFGDTAAYDRLARESEKLARRANQRLRELEKAGETGDAYKRIMDTLDGRKRFSQSHTGNAEEIFERARLAQSALARKDTTISEIWETDTKTLESLWERSGISGTPTREQVKNFREFVKSDLWNEYKSLMGGSGGKLDQFVNQLHDDVESVEDIVAAFREWEEQTEDRPDVYSAASEWFEM